MLLGIAGILLLTNANVFQKKGTAVSPGVKAWGGTTISTDLPGDKETQLPEATVTLQYTDTDPNAVIQPLPSYIIPSIHAGSKNGPEKNLQNPYDFNLFSAALSQSLTQQNAQVPPKTSTSIFYNAYSLVPRGLISASILGTPATKRTPEEKAFYAYGNAIGLQIQSFDSSHNNTTANLDAFFKDRTSQSKVTPLLALANDYEKLADDISGTENVPKELVGMHSSLAQGYRTISKGLVQLSKGGSDKELSDAVLAYDASADEFIKNFVALADFFSVRGIKFSGSDPGKIFTFNPIGF